MARAKRSAAQAMANATGAAVSDNFETFHPEETAPTLEAVAAEWSALAEQVLDSQSRGEDPAEPDVPPIDAARAAWYEIECRRNERAEWLVSSRGTISRAEDARDMLRVPQSFDLQQAEWARADYTRAGYETRLIRCSRGEGGIVREVVE